MNENFVSFRDPAGSLFKHKNKIFRFINPSYENEFNETITSENIKKLIENGYISAFNKLKKDEIQNLLKDEIFKNIFEKFKSNIILEHTVIDFANYPYEWSATQLFDSATLTLNLFEKVIDENLSLKDATPYNIIFENAKPVFVDLLSFEKKDPKDPIWLAYSQFVKTFLLPLFMNKFRSMPIHKVFLSNIDGLEIDDCLKHTSVFNPISYSLIKLPHFLSRFAKEKHYQTKKMQNPNLAKFILKRLIKKTKKRLNALKPKTNITSSWSEYMDTQKHYDKKDFSIKESFISDVMERQNPKKVLDVGCNTGHFSIIAAKMGAKVISIDYDPVVIDLLYTIAKNENLNILPLVVNISKPTPSIGWKNLEYQSFLKRADNYAELTFMLALIHHLQVTDRIPLFEIAAIANTLTKDGLVIEYVDPKDPMFIKIVRGRENLHLDININSFKKTFEDFFSIEKEQKINETRSVFYMRKK
ncbi:MAG: Ribosomal protein L11 methyltransferase [Candidatus Anoxychlamydiales bacterium]|nr:Ribosomal protein L11 methyltransferase [Candidatus Anoxychlamydiales bacterium]NGX35528.1 Ribosomal protein L11 methyltransferase [Candidatus Anoxychlamydiales bacterium]